MKKLLVVLLVALAAGMAFADTINIGTFPVGTWIDANWGAYWELKSDNIRILDAKGAVVYDFSKATIENFKVDATATGVSISFNCVETGKFYKLTKTLTTLDIVLEIDRAAQPHYSTTMKMK